MLQRDLTVCVSAAALGPGVADYGDDDSSGGDWSGEMTPTADGASAGFDYEGSVSGPNGQQVQLDGSDP